MKSTPAKEKLIVALDVGTAGAARRVCDALRGEVGMFKIGSELFTSEGPGFVRELIEAGARVFLDLKFYDIPNTVAGRHARPRASASRSSTSTPPGARR